MHIIKSLQVCNVFVPLWLKLQLRFFDNELCNSNCRSRGKNDATELRFLLIGH